MIFVNNFTAAVALPLAETELALDLPDGPYRLTLTDSVSAPTKWEIVGAILTAGTATLERGQEGTIALEWPIGSLIYCAVTAGVLTDVFAQIATLNSDLAALQLRVTALEPPKVTSAVVVTVGHDPLGSGKLGYFEGDSGYFGSVDPGSFDIPEVGACAVLEASSINYGVDGVSFELIIDGAWEPSIVESVDAPGIGLLALADAYQAESDVEEGRVMFGWFTSPGAGWSELDDRTITITFV